MGNDRLRRRNGEEKRARLYKANGSRLKGVYNRTEAKAHGWVKRHGHGQVYATVEECQTILEAAGENGLPVFVSFYRRALEKF